VPGTADLAIYTALRTNMAVFKKTLFLITMMSTVVFSTICRPAGSGLVGRAGVPG